MLDTSEVSLIYVIRYAQSVITPIRLRHWVSNCGWKTQSFTTKYSNGSLLYVSIILR